MPATHGHFEPGGDLESLVQQRPSADRLRSLSFPAVYDEVTLLVHPWVAPSFMSTVQPDWDFRRIGEHVAEVAGRVVGTVDDWTIKHEFVGSDVILGRRVDRVLITCFPLGLKAIGNLVGAQGFGVKSTLAVIAGLISSQDVGAIRPERLTLAIGWYQGYTEVSVHQHGSVRFAGYLQQNGGEPDVRRLQRLLESVDIETSRVSKIVLYGHGLDDRVFRGIGRASDAVVTWLRPSDIFDSSTRDITNESVFTPVAAGVLSRLLSQV